MKRVTLFWCVFVTSGKQGNVLSTQKVLCVAMVFCVYCKVMYVDGSEWDNNFKDDKVISGDGGENNEGTVGEIHVQDGSDSFDANECLNGKRCFYLSKTMVTHVGLATIKIPPRLKKRGRLKGC